MIKQLVVHCQEKPYDIYIGRPSVWGNPFSHKSGTVARYRVSTVEEAVRRYEEYIRAKPGLMALAKTSLKGKVLGCWCKSSRTPNALCHGDVLVKIANEEEPGNETATY